MRREPGRTSTRAWRSSRTTTTEKADAEEPTVVVGKVTRAHGVRGEVAVLVLSEVPDRFVEGARLWVDGGPALTISTTRPDRGRMLVTFREIRDREAAGKLGGRFLVVPESWLPELPDGQWWPHQIEGCEVVTETGRVLGSVAEVVSNPANDLWVAVDAEGTETFVPALRDVIADVDLDARRIVVRDVPGLTAPEG